MENIKTSENLIRIDFKRIGSRIGQKRREYGYKQSEISELVGISAKHMSNIETGKNKPSLEVLIKTAQVLDVSVDYFLTGTYFEKSASNIEGNAAMCNERDQKIIEDITNVFLKYQVESK